MKIKVLCIMTACLILMGCVTPITHESSLIQEPARKNDAIILFSAFGDSGKGDLVKGTVSVRLDQGNPDIYSVSHGEFRVARVIPGSKVVGIDVSSGLLFGDKKSWSIRPITVQAGSITYLGDFEIKRKSNEQLGLAINNRKKDILTRMKVMHEGLSRKFSVLEQYPAVQGGPVRAPQDTSRFANQRQNGRDNAVSSGSGGIPRPPAGGSTFVFYQNAMKESECTIVFDDDPTPRVVRNREYVVFRSSNEEAAFDFKCGNAVSRNYFKTEPDQIMAFAIRVRGSTIDLKRDKKNVGKLTQLTPSTRTR